MLKCKVKVWIISSCEGLKWPSFGRNSRKKLKFKSSFEWDIKDKNILFFGWKSREILDISMIKCKVKVWTIFWLKFEKNYFPTEIQRDNVNLFLGKSQGKLRTISRLKGDVRIIYGLESKESCSIFLGWNLGTICI